MIVADVMSRSIVTVMPGHSIRHAAQIMLDHRVSGLPVLDGDGLLVGILTEGDLLRRVEFGLTGGRPHWIAAVSPEGAARDYIRSHSWRVGDVMTKAVSTVTERTSLADVAVLFGTRGIKRVPVLHDGRLVGIVSRADLLRIVLSREPDGPALQPTDRALRENVVDALENRPWTSRRPVNVYANDGVVHLWGFVDGKDVRDAYRVAAENVPGVRRVKNHLRAVPALVGMRV